MARTIQIILTDDIDGSADAQPVSFGFAGNDYTIDLAPANLAKLEEALAPFIAKAERVGRRKGKRGAAVAKNDTSAIREWAAANGFEVSDRGRIPAAVLAAYEARK